MTEPLSPHAVAQALEQCAEEPIHIPGLIQPIGALMAAELDSGQVRYVSGNMADLLGKPPEAMFGATLRDLLGAEIWHQIRNLLNRVVAGTKRFEVGQMMLGDAPYAVHLSLAPTGDQGGWLVVELEPDDPTPPPDGDMLREQAFLVEQIQACESPMALHDLTCRLMRHVSGFDRVMIYAFDTDWNGKVLAEARKPRTEPYLGLNFPSWDIPAQAREMMTKIPLRLIGDITADPVPVLAEHAALPPLDLSLTQCRGVSPVHLDYLRNMGSHATMTLHVMVNGQLWGIISFHHERPRLVAPRLRKLLTGFLPVFTLKLSLLLEREALTLAQRVDRLQRDIQVTMEEGEDLTLVLERIGPEIGAALDICGIAMVADGQIVTYGEVPPDLVVRDLVDIARTKRSDIWTSDHLAEHVENPGQFAGACVTDRNQLPKAFAGACILPYPDTRALCVFRPERAQDVAWAGNPEKTIEEVDGQARLRPRGSFATFLNKVAGRSRPWTVEDRHLVTRLWPLLSAAERRAFMADLTRQQGLMIDELNHRVRNILSLVKSVSQQARREGGSLESYSQALESRIRALAAAHNIGAGAAQNAVSLRDMFGMEADPFRDIDGAPRVSVHGKDRYLRSDMAPIFALVIHELMTNAAKYGALSVPKGQVTVGLTPQEDGGIAITWREIGGPKVRNPNALGFGTTLIRQSVPYELRGSTDLRFAPHGVEVDLHLPEAVLDTAPPEGPPLQPLDGEAARPPVPRTLKDGLVLVVEDNFMIASDLARDLEEAGFETVETTGSVSTALEQIDDALPGLAILDVHLGHGETSEPVARALHAAGVPMLFVTGYGEAFRPSPPLDQVPVLTKPVDIAELLKALAGL